MSFCQQWRLNTSKQLWPNGKKIQKYNFPRKKAFCMNVFCFFPIISVQRSHLWKYWNYVIGICFTAILFPQLCNKKGGNIQITDQGSLIGNIYCEYSTVWKFSHFPATLILREINFRWFQKVKNSHVTNFGGFEFWLFENFKLENVKNVLKFKIQNLSHGQNAFFLGFKVTKVDFT